jgi:peptidoglycan/xylan/chitin deacetylase (PgdA/CDA1 family)
MVFVQANEKKIPILMYHSIKFAGSKVGQFTVPVTLFTEQMAYLHQNGYTPITVTQFINARGQDGSSLPERPVVITFDDGFADFFTEAFPVIQQYGFTATLYVATGFINGTSRLLQHEEEKPRLMLTWDQLSEISKYGIECGGHSHYHRQLDILPDAVAYDEIVRCKRLLEDHLGHDILSFAYPHGYHSAATKRLVSKAGYTSACAVKYVMSSEATDTFALARLLVSADTSVNGLAALLTKRPPSIAITIYIRARSPIWRIARRCSALVRKHLDGDLETISAISTS